MWSEVLKYILPSLVVFATAYLMMRTYLEKEQQQIRLQLRLENSKRLTPIRLQAYERLVLLMERISPESLIPRVYQKDMTPEQFHYALVTTVRKEIEHNLSQQIYVSNEAWEAVKSAKENVLKLINTVAADKEASKDVQKMSRIIIETYASVETTPTEAAIQILKQEVQELFG
jgi:hypothetical protein